MIFFPTLVNSVNYALLQIKIYFSSHAHHFCLSPFQSEIKNIVKQVYSILL